MPIPWSIEKYEEITSTQDIIKGMAGIGVPEGKVVQAQIQTQGRGRFGRTWVSPPGNLYFSFLLNPPCGVQELGQLSLLVAVALARVLRACMKVPDDLMLKWPNDILIAGKKCAGILIETDIGPDQALRWVAVGIGVNVEHAPRDENASSLRDYSFLKDISRDRLLEDFLSEFEALYRMWINEGFSAIKQEWLSYAHKKDTTVKVRVGLQLEQGLFHSINDDGSLLLRDADHRLKTITAGEVYL